VINLPLCKMCEHLKDEETCCSLAYKVLSAHNTKKLMDVEDVDELAWYGHLQGAAKNYHHLEYDYKVMLLLHLFSTVCSHMAFF